MIIENSKSKRSKYIHVRGANENNLKNVDVKIPRQAISIVTGLSGSGKSSLVFDTILSEAQRRFFYTLSHYSRQFLNLGPRAQVNQIDGLSPAIGLAQNETLASKKASIGTFTDLSELTGVAFSQFGEKRCPEHNQKTSTMSIDDAIQTLLDKHSDKLISICSPIAEKKTGQFLSLFESFNEKGYLRIYIDGKVVPLNPLPELVKNEKHTIKLIVDYVRIDKKNKARLLRSMKSATKESQGFIEFHLAKKNGQIEDEAIFRFSNKGGCPICHFSWPKLDPRYFSANSLGKCEACMGYGFEISAEEDIGEENEAFDFSVVQNKCSSCQGSGINNIYSSINIENKSVQELQEMSLEQLLFFWKNISEVELLNNPAFIRVRDEIKHILDKLCSLGISYLQMTRRILSLSGGELQRLKVATVLSENLRGVIYILDEPSQGLHPSEIDTLLNSLKQLRDLGNTVILVDHDQQLIRHADWLVDMGPGGGSFGGEVVASFIPKDAENFIKTSKTAEFLTSSKDFFSNKKSDHQIKSEQKFLTLCGAKKFNLNIPKVNFLLNAINVVSGVSGAGKSSLVLSTLFPVVKSLIDNSHCVKDIYNSLQNQYELDSIEGFKDFELIELVDRSPLARSTVSMPATYLDLFTPIRQIFEKLPNAQIMGLTSRDFSLSVKGGRCEECKGRGYISISMKFLPDTRTQCSHCLGKRYQNHILNLKFKDHSLADILNLSLNEAAELFKNNSKITKRLKPAIELGLSYLKLGQTSLSLSGGESQRMKLAPYLSKNKGKNKLLILDEPTQGLHTQDILLLMKSLRKLIHENSTIIMIEHSHEVLSSCDWLLDIGPGAAQKGGNLIFEGLPSEITKNPISLTGKYFKKNNS